MTKQSIDFGNIGTKQKALAALRKLGYVKATFIVARGSTTYRHPCGFTVTLNGHAFITTGPGPLQQWGCISNWLSEDEFFRKCEALRAAGVLGETAEINLFGFCAALAAAACLEGAVAA